jgi:hypothetical protein
MADLSAQEKEINDIIKKNLPAHVGEVLAKRLRDADDLERDFKHLSELHTKSVKEIDKLNEELRKHDQLDTRNKELLLREEAVKERENQAKIDQLTFELSIEREKSTFTKDVALGLVRNTTFRKTVFDNENQAPYQVPDGHGGTVQVWPTPINKNLTETKSEE